MSERIKSLIAMLKASELVVDGRVVALSLLDDIEHSRIETAQTWSPFGFLVLDVAPWSKDEFLRLHIWPPIRPSMTGPDWPIHPHSAHLKSWILTGSITNETYEVVPAEESSESVLYQASCPMGESLLEQTMVPVKYSLARACTYWTGEAYGVPRGEYHSTRVEGGSLTSTLCLMWDRATEKSLIVGSVGVEPELRFRRPSPTDEEIHDLVVALRERMTQDAAAANRGLAADA